MDELPDILLNLWLTAHGARDACYFDVHEETQEDLEAMGHAFRFAKELGLECTFDWFELEAGKRSRNVLFSRTPADPVCARSLRRLLGFTLGKEDYESCAQPGLLPEIWCTFHGWNATEIPAPCGRVQVFTYHAEVNPEIYPISQKRLELWKQTLREHPFPYASHLYLELEVRYKAAHSTEAGSVEPME
jgi:hypothetical protein